MPPKFLHDSPLAVTSFGTVLANITHVGSDSTNPQGALQAAMATGRPIFIGVVVSTEESREIRKRINEAAAEAVAVSYRARG